MLTAPHPDVAPRGVRVSPADVAACAGLVVVVIGTFLPWLHSGTVERNSYRAFGALKHLPGTPDLLGNVQPVWPFVILACALSVALMLLRLTIVAGAVTILAAAASGAVAIAVLTTHGVLSVRVAGFGPAVTLVGAALAVLAILTRTLVYLARRSTHRADSSVSPTDQLDRLSGRQR